VHSQNVKQCRFAGARGPHDGEKISLFHLKIDAAQNPSLRGAMLIKLFDVSQCDHPGNLIADFPVDMSLRLLRCIVLVVVLALVIERPRSENDSG